MNINNQKYIKREKYKNNDSLNKKMDKLKSKGFYITMWTLLALAIFSIGAYATTYTINSQGVFVDGNRSFARTAGQVVCKGENILEDAVKTFQCDVVCASIDSDCGDDINSASNNAGYGEDILLADPTIYPLTTTITLKYGQTLKGKLGLRHLNNANPDGNTTILLWNGVVGGKMIDASNAVLYNNISTFGLVELMLDGNFRAGYGLYKNESYRARHLNLNRVTVERINGTAFYFGGQVDDTSMFDVNIEKGGANSVGIENPNSMVRFYGGKIATQTKSAVHFGNTNFGGSMVFDGTIFSGNYNQFLLNTSQVMYGISCNNCWIEETGAGGIINSIRFTTDLQDINFVNSNIDTCLAFPAFNLTTAPASSKLNFVGGRTYWGSCNNATIKSNSNLSIVFLNHLNSERYNITGSPQLVRVENGELGFGTKDSKIYDDGALNLNSNTSLYMRANGGADNAFVYVQRLNLMNITSTNARICMDGNACTRYLQFNGTCIRAFGTAQTGACL